MCRIVYPILNDRNITKDIVQDVYLSLWKNRDKTQIKTSYKAYIYRACTLRAIDEIRKRKTKNTHFEKVKAISSISHNPVEEHINKMEMQAIISDAVQSLPETTREIFVLKRYSELKNKEIAIQLEVSIKTVESHMTKALKSLREILKPYMNSPMVMAFLCFITNYY